MNRKAKFLKAYEQLQMWSDQLPGIVKDCTANAFDAIKSDSQSDDFTPEQLAELTLRDIQKTIDDVMACFDDVLTSIDMPQRYSVFFRSLNMTPERWQTLLNILDEHERESA